MIVRFYAAACAAAGVDQVNITLSDLASPTQCSFLLDGVRSEHEAPLTEETRVDVLPPFAGG